MIWGQNLRPAKELTSGSPPTIPPSTRTVNILIAVCGIPAILRTCDRRMHDAAVVGFGIGLALALDEWVYLIATDGSNAAYIQPLSLISGTVMVGLACGYT